MRLLTAIALVVFCTILFLFRSELSTIPLPMINKQKLLPSTPRLPLKRFQHQGHLSMRGANDGVRSDRQ
jgi:hypothetical protein